MGFLSLVALAFGQAPPPRGLAQPGAALSPCPPTPNCVSTETSDPQHAMPTVPFTDAPDAAQVRARAALAAEPRTRVVLERPGYLRAESRSRLFRFVDDIEVAIDATARVFRFRSASRVGRSDLGVNRKRMERVSRRLLQR